MYFSLRSAMIKKETRKSNSEDEEYNLKKIKVSNTYPSIEMVNFCVNDTYKKRVPKKEWYKAESSLVRLLYFKFVIPQVYKIAENLGEEYFYLFAADKTEDRTLVNYYSQKLFFREHIKSKKYIEPEYDRHSCFFMYMKYDQLKILNQYIQANYNNLFSSNYLGKTNQITLNFNYKITYSTSC